MRHKIVIFLLCASVFIGAQIMSVPYAQAHEPSRYVVCNLNPSGDNFLALRSCPSRACDIIMKLGPNTGLLAMDPHSTAHWREVGVRNGVQGMTRGPTGWVVDEYICEVAY